MQKNTISAEFPFESKYIDVLDAKMHYIDEGEGDPILFLHGNPTSSYVWRNIIPHLVPQGRCIALDLIGMGKSDKPNISYRFVEHFKYMNGFIEKLELAYITLVLQDWGSGLGFHYATLNDDNVKALAFMEAILRPMSWTEFPIGPRIGFKLFRMPGIGWLMLSVMNMFVRQILPQMTVRKLTAQEMRRYLEPFPSIKSRRSVRQWPLEIPMGGRPEDMIELVSAYSQKLQISEAPKLLFYGNPGAIVNANAVEWCRRNLKNLKTVDVGDGLHYLQEDNPRLIGEELANWYTSL